NESRRRQAARWLRVERSILLVALVIVGALVTNGVLK
ncbi:unnamed protein product, partial [marine sediment metagenome]